MASGDSTTELTLYIAPLVNPYKLTMVAEELGIPYTTKIIDVQKGEHKSEWFTKNINANGKLPALSHKRSNGKEIVVWESGACLQYLADQFDPEHRLSYPRDTQEYYSTVSWLSWQVSGLGPMLGQSVHFLRYAYEEDLYGIRRYVAQSRMHFSVMEAHLKDKGTPYLVGDKCTIADIACFTWVIAAWYCGITIDEYPTVKAWRDRITAREAVQRGLDVPAPFFASDENTKDPDTKEMRVMIQKTTSEWLKADVENWYKAPGAGYME
ncbi:glutathione S-transferase [Rhizodiscina lignyota]|uniref:Glutathione S-transferase n=1 Tax=Rhizodiscina lignyota TaxID=1504668 RepID=A0A9P4IDQ5_9PEZI|nr:glutathione S-transferase [Rhizodiscina lignyota]